MKLEELKTNMSVLDQVLSKTSADIAVNTSASVTARSKILRKFSKASISAGIIAVVFLLSGLGDVDPQAFPMHMRLFLIVYCAMASAWYMFLYYRLRKMDVSRLKPAELFSGVARLKIFTLSGEIVFGIGLAVFFTMLISERIISGMLVMCLFFGVLAGALLLSLFYFWPQYVRLFRDLTSLK